MESNIKEIVAHSINDDDMNWTIECPGCNHESEWKGFFDSTEIYKCVKCKCEFKAKKMILSNGDYIL